MLLSIVLLKFVYSVAGDCFYGTNEEFEDEESKLEDGGEMILKSKMDKSINRKVQPIQYWLLEHLEFRLCNARGFTRNGCSTYSTTTILLIKHVTKNRSFDISIPFKKAQDIIEIMKDFINSNGDDDDVDES